MELLELLARRCRVPYISDLKTDADWKHVIKEIAPSDFPLKEWQETVSYLCETKELFRSEEQIKAYLIRWVN